MMMMMLLLLLLTAMCCFMETRLPQFKFKVIRVITWTMRQREIPWFSLGTAATATAVTTHYELLC